MQRCRVKSGPNSFYKPQANTYAFSLYMCFTIWLKVTDFWVNSPSARITNPEVLGLNPASVTFFWSSFLLQDLFATLFHTNLNFCHTYVSIIGPCKSARIKSGLSLGCQFIALMHATACIWRLLKYMADINQHQLLYEFILLSGSDLTLLCPFLLW